MRRLWLATVAIIALAASPALAWGPLAHEAVWIAARGMLGPEGEKAVASIIPPNTGPEMAWWADSYRAEPEGQDTARWHFVNLPLSGGPFDRQRDCAAREGDRALPGGACIVAAIEAMTTRFRDRELASPVRYQALAFLVHFVADIHQPLHATSNGDRGGNEVWVRLGGRTLRLHGVWDTPVVTPIDRDPASLARRIMEKASALSPSERLAMAVGTPSTWAEESRDVAREAIYRPLGRGSIPPPGGNSQGEPLVLPRGYLERQREVVMGQLVRAALRLAEALKGTR